MGDRGGGEQVVTNVHAVVTLPILMNVDLSPPA
jgi:hypothetical protein